MVNFQEAPRELFSDCLSIEMARFFKDLDEQYTHDLSLPVHHNPPLIRVAVLAPKLNWRKILGGRSLEILRNAFGTHYRFLTTPQR